MWSEPKGLVCRGLKSSNFRTGGIVVPWWLPPLLRQPAGCSLTRLLRRHRPETKAISAMVLAGFAIFGAQAEAGPKVYVLLFTTAATVTRPVDTISNGSGNTVPFASWYNSSAGTLYGCSTQDIMGTNKQPRLAGISAARPALNNLSLFCCG